MYFENLLATVRKYPIYVVGALVTAVACGPAALPLFLAVIAGLAVIAVPAAVVAAVRSCTSSAWLLYVINTIYAAAIARSGSPCPVARELRRGLLLVRKPVY